MENKTNNNPPAHKARRFIPNSHVMTCPQDVDAYASLMYNLTKCIGWVRTEKSEERMRVAIDSLAEYILDKFDKAYEPEEKEFLCDVETIDTRYSQKVVVAKDEDEAKRKVVDQMVQEDGMNPDIVYNVTRVKEAK